MSSVLHFQGDSEGMLSSEQLQGLVDDREITPEDSPSPRSRLLSTSDVNINGKDDHQRSRHRHRRRELAKLLLNEEYEGKQGRRVLYAALDQLESETQRAQQAERRALELAQNFKVVNDARLAAQQELNRVNEELRLYKMQFANAERELRRGQDILKDIEAQRDDAEAAAARARSTARRLKEEKLMNLARAEGHQQGYNEGLRRGYEEARSAGYTGRSSARELADLDDDAEQLHEPGPFNEDEEIDQPLDELSTNLRNLPSPPRDHTPLGGPSHLQEHTISMPQPHVAEGSRFREHIRSPSVLSSTFPPQHEAPKFIRVERNNDTSNAYRPDTAIPPEGWIPAADANSYISIPPPNALARPPPSPHSPSVALPIIPPEGTFVNRQLDGHGMQQDYAYVRKQRASPRSVAESLPSTTVSQYELVNPPDNGAKRYLRDQRSGLSAIQEVPSSMEFSPGRESRTTSTVMPEPIVFPVPANVEKTKEGSLGGARSRKNSIRLDENHRFSDPKSVDEWRRKSAEELKSTPSRSGSRSAHVTAPSPLSGRHVLPLDGRTLSPYGSAPSHHRRSNSANSHYSVGSDGRQRKRLEQNEDFSIFLQTPSQSSKHVSLVSPAAGGDPGLTPGVYRPTSPRIPTEPNTPTVAAMPSLGSLDHIPHIIPAPEGPPLGFVPLTPQMTQRTTSPFPAQSGNPPGAVQPIIPRQDIYSNYPIIPALPQAQYSSSSLSNGVNENYIPRPRTVSHSGNGENLRSRTPSARISAMASSTSLARSHTPIYAVAPTPSGKYSEPPALGVYGGTPGTMDTRLPPTNMSPRSNSSRLSTHQRSLSLNAGMTPAALSRPLSGAPQLRHVSSGASGLSVESGKSGPYGHYRPKDYVDPAFLASSEDLTLGSPTTMANTRANASAGPGQISFGVAGNGLRGSPAGSYTHLRP